MKIGKILDNSGKVRELKSFLNEIYNKDEGISVKLNEFSDEEIGTLAGNLRKGVPVATPVFDGAQESEIKRMLNSRTCPRTGRRTSGTGAPASVSIARSPSATCTC